MIVEHQFVTTLDRRTVMLAALQAMKEHDWKVDEIPSETLSDQQKGRDSLRMRRGRRFAAMARDIAQCPQELRLTWDRGRCTLLLSIEPNPRTCRSFLGGGSFISNQSSMQASPHTCDHVELLTVIATSLEDLLVRQRPAGQALAPWVSFEEHLAQKARRQRRHSLVLFIAMALVGGYGLYWWASNSIAH